MAGFGGLGLGLGSRAEYQFGDDMKIASSTFLPYSSLN